MFLSKCIYSVILLCVFYSLQAEAATPLDSDEDFLSDDEENTLLANPALADLIFSRSGADLMNLDADNAHSFHVALSDYAFLAMHYEAGTFADTILNNDSNHDGIPDWVEDLFPEAPNTPGTPFGMLDLDDNGIINFVQFELGMALDAESGGSVDTDMDGMSGAFENAVGLNPDHFADAVGDLDGDGLFNFEEYVNGTSPVRDFSFGSHQRIESRWYDTQDEGETFEVLVFKELTGGAAPLISDFEHYFGHQCLWLHVSEWSADGDPLPELPVATLTVEGMNALPEGSRLQYEPLALPFPVSPGDWDGDGLSNEVEYRMLRNYDGGSLSWIEISKALRNPDMNGDGIPDGMEDWDGDGLSNLDELRLGTLPWLADSDGDGFNDYNDPSPLDSGSSSLLLTITVPNQGEMIE